MADRIPIVKPGDSLPSGVKFESTHNPHQLSEINNPYMEGKKAINTGHRPCIRPTRGWERGYAAKYEAIFGKKDELKNVADAKEVSEDEFAVLMDIDELGDDVDRDLIESRFDNDKEITKAIDQLLERWIICVARNGNLMLMADGRKIVAEGGNAEEEK